MSPTAANADKPSLWKNDIALSVDYYNEWFMGFAPRAYRSRRLKATEDVTSALALTENLANIAPEVLKRHPSVLPMLRMSTSPPLARDRLIGLAGVTPNLVRSMEKSSRVPPQMGNDTLIVELKRIGEVISKLADEDIFPWLGGGHSPNQADIHRAATIVADRLCGAETDPIIRNAQEQRQLAAIRQWLEARGYHYVPSRHLRIDEMSPGTFSVRMNLPVRQSGRAKSINLPIDSIVLPPTSKRGDLPLMIEAKSAGDYTNTNKRRKEEATKIAQLKGTYGSSVRFVLFLCGYFDTGYLGYEAAEGIDWVWEHRMNDLAVLGL